MPKRNGQYEKAKAEGITRKLSPLVKSSRLSFYKLLTPIKDLEDKLKKQFTKTFLISIRQTDVEFM